MIKKIAINTGGGCPGVGTSVEGKTGMMVALQPSHICSVSLAEVLAK